MNQFKKNFPWEISQNYLFDFDGTLVDSMPFYVKAMLKILDENNISYEKNEIVRTITPLGAVKTAEYFISLGIDKSINTLVKEMYSSLEHCYSNEIIVKPYVKECLKYMKSRDIRLHVLTASPHRCLDSCLVRNGIYDLFDNVWSCEDFGTTKTDSNIYVQIAKYISEPIQNITFLDDNINAAKTAKRAGMIVIGVYDDFGRDEKDKFVQVTDGYIMDFNELMEQMKENV